MNADQRGFRGIVLFAFIRLYLWLNFFVVFQVFFELGERRVKVFRNFDLALENIPRKCRASILVLWLDRSDASETFLLRRRDQAARHFANGFFGNDAVARLIAGDAGLDGHIEE
jgi:hypothetical protein